MATQMKDFVVVGPDGKEYVVTASPDATDEELISFAQSQAPAPTSSAPQTVPQPQSPAPATNVAQPPVQAPQGPQTPLTEAQQVTPATPEAETVTNYKGGFLLEGPEAPKNPLLEDANVAASQLSQMLADPSFTEEQVREFSSSLPFNFQGLEENLAARKEGKPLGGVSVNQAAFDLAKAEAPPPNLDRSIWERVQDGYRSGGTSGFPGWLSNKFYDFSDAGIEELKKAYPGKDDEWYEQMSDYAIAQTQRRMREEIDLRREADPNWQPSERFVESILATAGDFVGEGLGSFGPEAALNPGSTFARRAASQAAVGGLSDLGYQAGDVSRGVADEISAEQVALNAAFGVAGEALQTGVVRGYDRLRGRDPSAPAVKAPEPEELTVSVPENAKGSRQYKQQLDKTQDEIVAVITQTTKDWTNTPAFTVHKNFNALKGIDNDAIGVIRGDEVFINTEVVLRDAEASGIKPEEIVKAVTFHEGLGHYGLAQQFGDDLDEIMGGLLERSPEFSRDVDAWIEKNPNSYAGPNQRIRAAEEIFSEMSEEGVHSVALVDKVSNLVKKYARQLGLKLDISKREAKSILAMAHNATVNGKKNSVSDNGFRYQGSPYERAFLEYATAYQRRPSDLLKELEDGRNSQGLEEIRVRANQLAGEPRYSLGSRPAVDDRFVRRDQSTRRSVQEENIRQDSLAAVRAGIDPEELGLPRPPTRREQILEASKKLSYTPKGSTRTVRPFPDEEPDYYRFRYNGTEGEVTGTYHVEGDKITNVSLNSEGGPRSVGPKAVRTAIKQVLREHPSVKSVQGYRISGARKNNEFVEVDTGDARYMRPKSGRNPYDLSIEEMSEIQSADEILSAVRANHTKTYRSLDEARESAARKGLTSSQYKNERGLEDLDVRLFQYEAVAQRLNTKLTKLHAKMNNGTFTIRDKAEYLKTVYGFNNLTGKIFNDQAQIGRALNAVKALDFTKRNITELNEVLSEFQGGQGISAFADDKVFQEFADQIRYKLESGDIDGAAKITSQVVKPYWWQYILTFRHAAMLSGTGTQVKNTFDNGLMIARELQESVLALPGGVVRKGLRYMTKQDIKEGVSVEEVMARTYGLVRALLDTGTYRNAVDAFNQGHGSRPYSAKIEMQDARIPVVSAVNDFLYAQDIFFRAFHQNANLYSLGVRRSREAGNKGMQAFQDGTARAQNPGEGLVQEANLRTDEALLVDTPSKLFATQQIEQLKQIRPGMDAWEQAGSFFSNILFPFLRVTDRLVFQALRRSPLAFLDKNTRRDFNAGGAARDIAIARATYGSALIAYYWYGAGQGDVRGTENDYKKRDALQGVGVRPNAVLDEENDRYVDATALNLSFLPSDQQNAVATNIASIRADWERDKDEKGTAERLGAALMGITTILSSQSYGENLALYLGILDESDQATKTTALANFTAGQASAFVPAALRQANQTFVDPIQRDTTGDKSFGDRVAGRVMSGIPGLSDNLPVKYDVYGEEIPQNRTLSGVGNYTDIKQGEVYEEIRDLELSRDDTVVLGAPSSFQHKASAGLRNGDETVRLTAEQKQEWQRVQGYYLKLLMSEQISNPEWKRLSDDQKVEVVKKQRERARDGAKKHILDLMELE